MKTIFGSLLKQFGLYLGVIALPMFFIFAAHSLTIGGDALNGYVTKDGFFVSSHDTDTEVSELSYNVSWWLGICTFLTFIPAVLFSAIGGKLAKD